MKRLFRKYVQKVRRLRLPRPLKHMADCSPHLQLRPASAGAVDRQLVWRGKVMSTLQSYDSLRGKCSGDCFVVAAGPSLAHVDLRQVAHWPTIGVNGSIVKFLQDGVLPSYYSITDPDFFEHRFSLVHEVLASGALCFFSYKGLSWLCERDASLLSGVPLCLSEIVNRRYFFPRLSPAECDAASERDPDLVLHPTVRLREGLVGFSRNMAKGMFCGQTVGYRGIQIAYHLGFRRVFLLGMDMGELYGRVRFYEAPAASRPSLLQQHYVEFIRPCFEIVKSLCDAGEFEVYNCSLDSRLPESLIPKIPLDDAVALCRQARAA